MEEKLLKIIGLAHVVGGLALTTVLFIEPTHPFLLEVLYGSSSVPNQAQIFFWFSILGPTIASWGLLFYSAIYQYFLNPNNQAFYLMAGSVLLWAPLDSALCIYNGIYIAALGNFVVFFIIMFLLYRVKKQANGN